MDRQVEDQGREDERDGRSRPAWAIWAGVAVAVTLGGAVWVGGVAQATVLVQAAGFLVVIGMVLAAKFKRGTSFVVDRRSPAAVLGALIIGGLTLFAVNNPTFLVDLWR